MNKKLLVFTSKKNALLLSAFAAVCTLLVSVTFVLTAPVIEQQAQQDLLNKVNQVLLPERFDNNPLKNCLNLTDKSIFGDDKQHVIYRATYQEQPYALVFQTQTSKGYNGLIQVMVAIDSNGVVQGVRALKHQETPGLGDKIDLEKSDWVLSFNDMKVKNEEDKRWFVKKDGGYFDQFTGATITPRAIVNQLRQSVSYVASNFDRLFAMQNECILATPMTVEPLLDTPVISVPVTTDEVKSVPIADDEAPDEGIENPVDDAPTTDKNKDEVSNDQ